MFRKCWGFQEFLQFSSFRSKNADKETLALTGQKLWGFIRISRICKHKKVSRSKMQYLDSNGGTENDKVFTDFVTSKGCMRLLSKEVTSVSAIWCSEGQLGCVKIARISSSVRSTIALNFNQSNGCCITSCGKLRLEIDLSYLQVVKYNTSFRAPNRLTKQLARSTLQCCWMCKATSPHWANQYSGHTSTSGHLN